MRRRFMQNHAADVCSELLLIVLPQPPISIGLH